MSDKIISHYRKILSREKGTIYKDWGGRVSVAIAYPNYYRVGMSNLGFQVVYSILNDREDVVAERIFMPDREEMSFYKDNGRGILSLESQSPLNRFDVVAFTLSFENDYENVLSIIDMGKIPLIAEKRGREAPLIMAGGITTFLNPEPLALFFDLFLLGEAEVMLNDFMDLYIDSSQSTMDKVEFLKSIAGFQSAYIPSLYSVDYNQDGTIRSRTPRYGIAPEKVVVSHSSVDGLPLSRSVFKTEGSELADRKLIELGRGCGRSCRFCAAGFVYRPPRNHDEKRLLSAIGESLEKGDRVGLLSTSVLDTPGIEEVMDLISNREGRFSLSSLRADMLSIGILERMKKTGQKSLAIAPEAGTERLRRVINKHLTKEQITSAAGMIGRVGDFHLRLYFLIGLPTETMDDVAAILKLVKSIKHHMIKESKHRGSIGRINLSINCFVPKPFTPFQWFPMDEMDSLKKKQRWLKKAFSKEGGVSIGFDVPKYAYAQALLSMGDRRTGAILLKVHENNGDWIKSLRYSELNPDFFVYRPRRLEENLPWDFIDHGIHKEFLLKEHKLALKEMESEVCRPGECSRCGVCGSEDRAKQD